MFFQESQISQDKQSDLIGLGEGPGDCPPSVTSTSTARKRKEKEAKQAQQATIRHSDLSVSNKNKS